jgi:hypothetical protein
MNRDEFQTAGKISDPIGYTPGGCTILDERFFQLDYPFDISFNRAGYLIRCRVKGAIGPSMNPEKNEGGPGSETALK